ncbi:host specificity protein J [Psychrobacter nivimaris]|uniref:host specificity protein J n=1 Tax=Psychrobacter nivimaris TaxID=281738 RepID=UPI001918BB4D|nr:phage tail protein [Psychrobacter nivimaris]
MTIKWRNDGSGLGDGVNGLVVHDCVYRKPIKGAKAGSGESRKPSIAKDSVASTSTAKILYILGEGEIAGLVNGGKSIYLDGTPLLDDAGNSNFDGVTWDFRTGTNEQEYIKGFPDVSNETPINIELRSDNPWIKAFTDTQLSAVRIRFKWNRLSKTDPNSGDVKGYKVQYAIDLQTNGGAYVEVLNTKIEDKTSAGYERTHRIDLPKSTTGWQIRVRRLTANDSSEYVQDDMFIDAVAEVIDVKLRYPNTALLGLQYNAETFSGIAKMAARIRGMIIRVPSNYDAVARTYTGIWDGTFKDAYSNNPAWVYFDLCTQWRYGLGERLDLTMIDKWSLYALGQYCDQMVSNGQGGLEPRFTCNVYLQKQADAYQVLSNIAGIFRAMSYWNGQQVVLDADVPQDPVYTFSRANVIDGNFEYTGTRARDRHTLAKVAWDNPLNGFETEYEYIRDEKAMAKFGVKVLDLAAFGCTSQAQAQRAGLWALKTEQLETRQVSFGVGLDGFIPQVGNIINVSDELFAGRANGGRVSAVSDAQYVVTVDRDIVANAGDILIVNGGGGQSERRTIKSVSGRKITLNAAFTAAEAENVWAIETTDLKLMRFRVMNSKQNDDATFSITAIQHEPQKYDVIDYGTDVQPTNITIVNPDVVDAPTSVTITSRHRVVQGQTVTTLVIGWSQVKDAVAYDVEWRKDDGSWIKLPRTGNVSVEIEGVYSGNYLARVRAVSAFDVQSQPTTSLLTAIQGKVGLPPTIIGLTATGVLFGMELKWGFGTGSGDAAYTEIETGSAPNTNVKLLGQYSYPTNTHTVTGLQGNLSQSYRARLVDKLGFKSAWSAWVTGTTDASADKVMNLIQGQIDESSLNASLTSKIGKISENEDAIGQETADRIQDIIDANERIDGVIESADVEYYLSSNATTPTGGTWQTTAPVWQQSKYMFSRTKLKGADGAITYKPSVNGTNITGAKGDSGASGAKGEIGQGIDSIVEQYGVSQSESTVPTTWTASAPIVNKGDYVWTRSKITYKNPTKVEYSTPIVSPAWFAISEFNTEFIDFQEDTGDEFQAQGEKLEGIISDYKPRYADASKYANASRSTNWTYWKTVSRDNYAANERITNLQSEVATSNAQLVQRIETEATATSALAREVTTLEATVGGNTASLRETKQVVDGIKGEYTLKLDVGGKVAGYGLVNNAGQPSAFDIRADMFSVSAPVGKPNDVSGTSPWMVLTTPQVIDGVTVPAGAYARNFYAPRASIDTIQIKDAAIKSAQIDNLAVTSAKIGDAQVDTLKIKKDSVIVPRVQTFSGNVDLIGSDAATGYTFGSISLDPEGGNVSIQVTFARVGLIRGTGGSSINGAIVFEVLRDGSTVVGSFSRNVDADTYFDMATIPTMVDSNISGTHTYSVRVRHNSTRGNTTLYFREDRSIHVMGAKR